MISNFYLDECNNTGDLSIISGDTYLAEQRIFALAGFGMPKESDLFQEVEALKKQHRIQGADMKSKETFNKPKFVIDLLRTLNDRACPVFVEVVDKHYYVAMNMVSWMIIRPIGPGDYTPRATWLRTVMADYLAVYMPPQLAVDFATCCQSRDHTAIRTLYKSIIAWAENSPVDVAKAVATFARDSLKDFRKLPRQKAIEKALPPPDVNKHGKMMWVLPNLSSFTSIYARINRYARKDIGGISIFHDEQLQFDETLLLNKEIMEGHNAAEGMPRLKNADYDFKSVASLKFQNSKASTGIQIADTIAGFAARYLQERVWSEQPVHPDKIEAFHLLHSMGVHEKGTGINFVAPNALIKHIGFQPTYNF